MGILRSNALLLNYETFRTGSDNIKKEPNDYTQAMLIGLADIIYHVYMKYFGEELGGDYSYFSWLAPIMLIVDLYTLAMATFFRFAKPDFWNATFWFLFFFPYFCVMGFDFVYDILPFLYVIMTLPEDIQDYSGNDWVVFVTMLISFGMLYLDCIQTWVLYVPFIKAYNPEEK